MIANLILVIWINLVDQYNNTHHHSITKKPTNVDYFALIEKTKKNHKPNINDQVRITKYMNILVKVTLKIGQKKYLILPWKLIRGLIILKM